MSLAQYLSPMALVPALVASGLAEAGGRYHQARVVHVQPEYETVSYTVPTEQCSLQEVAYDDGYRYHRGSAAAPIVGAIIGGALGNAVTRGKKDKRLGTAVGAVLGAGIGANASRRHATDHYQPRTSYRTERVCQIVDEVREEQRVTGYRVRYRYAGETYVTYMDRDPGRFLKVRVDVTPV